MISVYPECQCTWVSCTHPIMSGESVNPWTESPCFQTARYLVARIAKYGWNDWNMPPLYMCDQCSASWLKDCSLPVIAVDIECLSPDDLWQHWDGILRITGTREGNCAYSLLLLDDGTPNVTVW